MTGRSEVPRSFCCAARVPRPCPSHEVIAARFTKKVRALQLGREMYLSRACVFARHQPGRGWRLASCCAAAGIVISAGVTALLQYVPRIDTREDNFPGFSTNHAEHVDEPSPPRTGQGRCQELKRRELRVVQLRKAHHG